ncbi:MULTISPECIES: TIGR03767 family metallophosphoesterase [Tsukamurella]|uniref:TIGR03767 family metallophosphoesterase n=2 Tax=Tsukamurella TaxID=2060 RepID=A0A5C5RWZ5_9ACTN|nr:MULTISPECIES: TIGR03767 family metallophosphoesterase [Tsukamurella]NMD55889.1 TIGR03767 family metallophosphoesterase [Tsukamurella columbiensis]TWS27579.1 TIGR03767 family metallophosphoesterase [Tsukamurella conjunctivitidis]
MTTRRGFLRAGAVAALATATAAATGRIAHALPGTTVAGRITGTTLERVSVPGQARAGGYRPLVDGAGWPLYVRQELATAGATREAMRAPLASFVQLTDMHIVDAQSPARFEFVHPFQAPAFRPQETLTTQGAVSLVERINAIGSGPFTGRAFDCVITTGDNTDNREFAELNWFQTVLSGGTVVPNTGAPDRFEGLQAHGAALYWQPESPYWDMYKDKGFQQIPGFLRAAIGAHTSPGLRMPWYAVVGNHDDSLLGTLPNGIADWLYLSPVKLDIPHTDPAALAIARALTTDPSQVGPMLTKLKLSGPVIPVTVDPKRAPFSPRDFVRRHFDPAVTGPGPVGHGFSSPDGPTWYTFQIAPGVLGIALDTTNNLGIAEGTIGEKQLAWLVAQLKAHPDQLVIVFSHHTSKSMTAGLPDPEEPGEKQYQGEVVVKTLTDHPNVIAWVNGHTHKNEMIAHTGPTPKQSFWEINTASHVDFPQLARIIEVADNRDGTISLFTPLIEAASPATANPSDLSAKGLASLYRELAYNDIHRDDKLLGAEADRNCELLLTHPLR